jgi:hypothetical protein
MRSLLPALVLALAGCASAPRVEGFAVLQVSGFG